MSDIRIRKIGKTGRITFNRPQALNAMSYQMCLAIESALDEWNIDDDVKMVVIDAEGEKAFCAGGDIAELYESGTKGNFLYGQQFWADEYRMNAKIFAFPKPVAAFMQGYTMGGGVGVGCHGSHRVVGDSSQISMPECSIGLVPDVGGSYILANAPGRLGEFLGLTAARLRAEDAIYSGFADYYIPETAWPALITSLENTGDWTLIDQSRQPPKLSEIAKQESEINEFFSGETLIDIVNLLDATNSDFARNTLKKLSRNSPLSMGCTLEIIHRVRLRDNFRAALAQEYQFTYRAIEHGDFLEGIRAQIIDKDRNPHWKHQLRDLPAIAVSQMLLPLGAASLTFGKGN